MKFWYDCEYCPVGPQLNDVFSVDEAVVCNYCNGPVTRRKRDEEVEEERRAFDEAGGGPRGHRREQ